MTKEMLADINKMSKLIDESDTTLKNIAAIVNDPNGFTIDVSYDGEVSIGGLNDDPDDMLCLVPVPNNFHPRQIFLNYIQYMHDALEAEREKFNNI